MKVLEESLAGGFYDSRIFSEYFGGKRLVAADIESTGLSPKHNAVILGGAVTAEGNGRRAHQFFAESRAEEPALLEQYAALLAQHDVMITYNGQAFDIPFLVKRMRKYGLDTEPLESVYSLDLYRVIAKYSHLKQLLPDLKQKTVEAYMGDAVDRTDTLSGKETAELYQRFENCDVPYQREPMAARILLHNRDDVVRLSEMLRILRNLDLHRILFHEGIPVTAGEQKLVLRDVKLGKDALRAAGRVFGSVRDHAHYGEGVELRLSGRKREAALRVDCEEVEGYLVADIRGMGLDDGALQTLGGYESGYLILKDKSGRVMYHEVNRLLACVTASVLQ